MCYLLLSTLNQQQCLAKIKLDFREHFLRVYAYFLRRWDFYSQQTMSVLLNLCAPAFGVIKGRFFAPVLIWPRSANYVCKFAGRTCKLLSVSLISNTIISPSISHYVSTLTWTRPMHMQDGNYCRRQTKILLHIF